MTVMLLDFDSHGNGDLDDAFHALTHEAESAT